MRFYRASSEQVSPLDQAVIVWISILCFSYIRRVVVSRVALCGCRMSAKMTMFATEAPTQVVRLEFNYAA